MFFDEMEDFLGMQAFVNEGFENIAKLAENAAKLQRGILLLGNQGLWPDFQINASHIYGGDPKEIFGFSDEHLTSFYACMQEHFEKGAYLEARDICLVLLSLDDGDMAFWIALGMCEQMLNHGEAAIEAYGKAFLLSDDYGEPIPALYAAKCLVHLGQPDLAKELLESLVEMGSEFSDFTLEAKDLIKSLS